MSNDEWRRRHMLSDDKWRELTEKFPGLEKQPPALSRMAFHIVEWETEKRHAFKASLPSDRKSAYSDAAKKIRSALEAMKVALDDQGDSSFEVLPAAVFGGISERNQFFRNVVYDLEACGNGFSDAVSKVKPGKTGPNNSMLRTYVWMVADWFERNGRGDRISAGEESYSIKVFIKDIFKEFDFCVPDRALADAIRSYPKKAR